MPQYRFKPSVTRLALKWTGNNIREMLLHLNGLTLEVSDTHIDRDVLFLQTPHGQAACRVGDYCIIDQQGQPYPCSKEVFEATYDLIS